MMASGTGSMPDRSQDTSGRGTPYLIIRLKG